MSVWRSRTKVFCIGRNKTGTTSLASLLGQLGYRLGKQGTAEYMLDDWARRDFRKIIRYCRKADAFQDIPFSLNYTYQAVDSAFPGSRFILTVRNDADQWYDSLTRYHTKIVGVGRLPTAEDLKQYSYRETGWLWKSQRLVYGIDEQSLYDKARYVQHYIDHIKDVTEYFRYRPDDLLTLNIEDEDAVDRLCAFLGTANPNLSMPHLNRSKEDA